MKKRIEGVTVYGIDIGKNIFHVVGLDSSGEPVLHSKFDVIDCSSTSRTRLQRLLVWRAVQDHSGWHASSRRQATQSGLFPLSS